MPAPILPSADAILTPAIDSIVASLPQSLAHFNDPAGRWADLPALWRAQLLLLLARLGDEVQSARLRFSKGAALRALAASEFDTTLPPEPQAAYATVSLVRSASPNQPQLPQGAIRPTDLFRKNANPNATPLPIAAATYAPIHTVYVAAGQTQVTVPLRAVSASADGNVPTFAFLTNGTLATVINTSIAPAQPIPFDARWATQFCTAAGGSGGLTDPVLVAAARAFAVGRFGPTDGALIAGLLRQQSVRHDAVFRASTDVPYSQVYVADESWASDPGWIGVVGQSVNDNFLGFGCRARYGSVTNQQVALNAVIALASTEDLNSSDAIDVNVRATAESYFNDRPDWYRFRLSTLRALLSKCDARIQECRSVVLTDALTGAIVPEPPNTFGLEWVPTLVHYYLTDKLVTTLYLPPA